MIFFYLSIIVLNVLLITSFTSNKPMKSVRKLRIATVSDISKNSVIPAKELNRRILSKSFRVTWNSGIETILEFTQSVSGVVPRSYLPAIVKLSSSVNLSLFDINSFYETFEIFLQWYLGSGGRIKQLQLYLPSELSVDLRNIGHRSHLMGSTIPLNTDIWQFDSRFLIQHFRDRLSMGGNEYILYDIIGRLYHDTGHPDKSIEFYTKALTFNPKSSSTFRNLGSAYHATGNMQLSFASYQQALQLNSSDALVYLKLAFFYEDYASKDWSEASENAINCYQYYIKHVDSEDTGVLTRLGNLYVREHQSENAIQIYNKILSLDRSLTNVWFNKAHAEIKLGLFDSAAISLKKTIELDPSISAAKHMLKAFDEDEAINVTKSDEKYIKDLYNTYANNYDEHTKKLLYATPRVIRQELGKIYRERLNISVDSLAEVLMVSPPAAKRGLTPLSTCDHDIDQNMTNHKRNDCETQLSFMNKQLDILDLGCGTGLSGAWLKDYAKSLVGIDISEEMVGMARKKDLYDHLYVNSIHNYLTNKKTITKHNSYDLIVAAEVFSYIGDLQETIQQVTLFDLSSLSFMIFHVRCQQL